MSGINIQWPISEEIISGKKTIETRTYQIPDKYLDRPIYLIETPGKNGKFKSRITGIIKFKSCFKYSSRAAFYRDVDKHLVTEESPWRWADKPKYGWVVEVLERFPAPIDFSNRKKGIVFTTNINLTRTTLV